MKRVYNFSAGPACLPEEVLKEAAEEMLDYNGSGMSVMEMSHRSLAFDQIIRTAEQDLRDLMQIPDNYKVLFLQGGASQQFAMIPMNLMRTAWPIISSPASGRRRHGRKHRNTERPTRSPLPRIRPFPISRTAAIFLSARMRITSTSVKTIRFTEQNSKNSPTRKERLWWLTCPPVSFPNRWM